MNYEETTEPTAHTDEVAPCIHVVSLADHRAGKQHGRWIEADQDAAAIHAEILLMLAESSEPDTSHWAIKESDGFGVWSPGEQESIEVVSAIAKEIVVHGTLFTSLYVSLAGIFDLTQRCMRRGYRGSWSSLAAYLKHRLGDVYSHELRALPRILRSHIDYEQIAQTLEGDGSILTIEGDSGVHIF